jgi:hypothetical protein
MRLALIPSPFVGASTWQPAAECLPDAIAVNYGGVSPPDWYEGIARRIAARVDERPWVAVLHSGAGGLAPAIACAARNLSGFIFVDAVLPHPGKSTLETAPVRFVQALKRATVNGMLKPWNEWFDSDPAALLIPDPQTRANFVRDLPCVPFAFLEAKSPNTSEWEQLPAAYLQLSRVYEKTAEEAERRGWFVRRENMHHLAMASDPAQIGEILTGIPLRRVDSSTNLTCSTESLRRRTPSSARRWVTAQWRRH